jgi:pimeloyl-ACP methyl ester carboxylesterase
LHREARMIPKKYKRPTGEVAGCTPPDEDLASCPVLLVPGWGAPLWHTHWIARQLERAGLSVEEMKLPFLAVGDMRRSAAMVKDQVEQIRERTGSDRVSLISYSLGGLIERIYLQELGGYEHLGRAVFVGSPQDGIYTACEGAFTKAGRQVSKGSKFMRNLNRGAHLRMRRASVPVDIPLEGRDHLPVPECAPELRLQPRARLARAALGARVQPAGRAGRRRLPEGRGSRRGGPRSAG